MKRFLETVGEGGRGLSQQVIYRFLGNGGCLAGRRACGDLCRCRQAIAARLQEQRRQPEEVG